MMSIGGEGADREKPIKHRLLWCYSISVSLSLSSGRWLVVVGKW